MCGFTSILPDVIAGQQDYDKTLCVVFGGDFSLGRASVSKVCDQGCDLTVGPILCGQHVSCWIPRFQQAWASILVMHLGGGSKSFFVTPNCFCSKKWAGWTGVIDVNGWMTSFLGPVPFVYGFLTNSFVFQMEPFEQAEERQRIDVTRSFKVIQGQSSRCFIVMRKLCCHTRNILLLFFSIELFQNMCGELKDWIKEKQSVLGNEDLGKDLRSVQALQRKHQVNFALRCLRDSDERHPQTGASTKSQWHSGSLLLLCKESFSTKSQESKAKRKKVRV